MEMENEARRREEYLNGFFERFRKEIEMMGYHGRIQDTLLNYTIRRMCEDWGCELSQDEIRRMEQKAYESDLVFKDAGHRRKADDAPVPPMRRQTMKRERKEEEDRRNRGPATIEETIETKRQILKLYRRSGAVTPETIAGLEREIADLENK